MSGSVCSVMYEAEGRVVSIFLFLRREDGRFFAFVAKPLLEYWKALSFVEGGARIAFQDFLD